MKKFYLLSTALLFSLICFSQAGNFDPSFGIAGKVNTNILDINKGNENINGIAIQPDGKIITAGTTMSPGAIFRYNPDGTPDNSFHGDGIFLSFGYKFTAVVLQPDGKIVGAGTGFLMRLNSNGTPDNSFGNSGIAPGVTANSIVLQSDGKIVTGGSSILARFNTDGSPDNSFDGDGQRTILFGPQDNQIRNVSLQSDGKLLVAGHYYNGANATRFAIARCNSNGSPDNSFDGDGILTTAFSDSDDDLATSIVVQNDGKILAAGFTNHDLAIARYHNNGSPDNSFDEDGKVTAITGTSHTYPVSMALLSNGKILVATSNSSDFVLLRFNTDGLPDNSFDGDGRVTTDLSAYDDYSSCMGLQSNGKIVLGGTSFNSSGRDFALACYNDDGSPDNSFDGDGKLLYYFGTSFDEARGLAIQNDGKILIGGWTGTTDMSNNNDYVLTRYHPNGTLDNSFDGDGKLVATFGTGDDRINAIAIQNDGKIVAAGQSGDAGNYSFALARYNANGSIDNSFDGDGKLTTVLSPSHNYITAIAIQSDGKIVAAGFCGTNDGYDFALARYNIDGSLDNSFDGDGKIILSLSPTADVIRSLAIQSDGKIVVSGSTGIGVDVDFATVRFNLNGTLDNSFGVNGIVITDINSSIDYGNSMTIQNDGKIVVGGNTRDFNGTYNDFALVRYNTNGSLDNSFDSDGKFTAVSGYVNCLVIQTDGKILVGGDDFTFLRLNTDGTPDNSFDGDGRLSVNLGMGAQHLYAIKLLSNRIYLAGMAFTAGATDFALAVVLNDALQGALPLQLRDFSGKRVNEDALLTWKTENESDMLEYIVERSIDGRNYTDVGTISAANRAGLYNYNFTDYNITSLNVPVIYYRLRQRGIDGKYSYSRIIALPLERNKNIVLFYPNPVIHDLNIALTVSRQDRLRIRIIDNKGRLVKEQQWNVSAGSTSQSIDVSNLAAGMYYLEIKGETIDYRKQFVK